MGRQLGPFQFRDSSELHQLLGLTAEQRQDNPGVTKEERQAVQAQGGLRMEGKVVNLNSEDNQERRRT